MDVNANNIEAIFDVETVELESEFDVERQSFDALFEINATPEIRGSELIGVNGQQIITITSKTFTFEQGIASDTWIIQHNLGDKKPSVTIVDSSGKVQLPNEIEYTDESTITVSFLGAFAGKAFLN